MILQFDVPDDLLQTPYELLLAILAHFFNQRKLSASKAARVAGMSRLEFVQNVGRFGVPVFDLTTEEFEADLRSARKHS